MKLSPFAIFLSLCIAAQAAPDFARDVKPLLTTHCASCHGGGKKKGGISLDSFTTPEAMLKDQKLWAAVLENVKSGVMPPEDEKELTLEEREKITGWINRVVFSTDPNKPDPGRVTIRRLNRVEYANTIRDLIGVTFNPADNFPADDSGYGFDNIGDVLSLPPVLFERYLAAAEKIMGSAILNDHTPRADSVSVDLLKLQGGPGAGSTATARRVNEVAATGTIEMPVLGDYTVVLTLAGGKVGTDPTKMEVKFAAEPPRVVALRNERNLPETHKFQIKVEKPGPYPFTVRVANPLAKPEMKDGKPVTRTFTLRKMQFVSPPQAVKAPATQVRIFAPGRGQPNLDLSARAIITAFATRGFRRPLGGNEVDRFMWIFRQAGLKGGNFEQSVQTALTAILVSPHFLFRGEFQPEPDNPTVAHTVNEWALASRLSYFLWSTMPDDALFAEAQRGTLRKNLDAQLKRMLKDPKANALTENFAGQWLQVRNLRLVQPDPKTFPAWDDGLATAMERETEMLFEHIMREDRSVMEFISADYTFVNEQLAQHYGIGGVEGDAFAKVKLPANRPGGILGHGGFLTLTSNPTRTSPVKRGKYVLENILGTPPPPAPPDVPDLNDAKRAELAGTLRQKMEQHRKDPTCASCHARMDPIGFGLEQFDGIGAWRALDGNSEVDTSGQLVSGESFKGPQELRQILLTKKRGEFLRCLSEKMLTYALGRGLEFYDRPTVEKMVANIDKGGAKFSTLIMETVRSVPFQMRRGEGDHRKFTEGAKTALAK